MVCISCIQVGDGGLQLLSRNGVWQAVVVPRGMLLVNLGSLLTRWTNGRWKSTLHRVTNPTEATLDRPIMTSYRTSSPTRRFSLAYFHKVNIDTEVSPHAFPSCVERSGGRGGAATLQPVRAMDLTRQGILHKHRHLPAAEASAAYHAELAAIRDQTESL